jgi:hypothetical protein
MKDTNMSAMILISFIALISGIVLIGTQYYGAQANSFKSKLLNLGYQVKSLDISTPINCTSLSESQFLDKIKDVNATVVYQDYYTFFVFTSDLKNGYTYSITN